MAQLEPYRDHDMGQLEPYRDHDMAQLEPYRDHDMGQLNPIDLIKTGPPESIDHINRYMGQLDPIETKT